MTRIWSPFQQAIFTDVQHGTGNLFVSAVAGSGKSSTIIEATKYCVGTRVVLAFNKPIADELNSRGVYAKTFHSLCNSAVKKFKQTHDIDTRKLIRVFNEVRTRSDDYLYSAFVRRLVGLGKQAGIGCKGLLADIPTNWRRLVEHNELSLESVACSMERALDLASELLQASNADPMYDFDDMLYLAVYHDLALPQFDTVFVDEAQDTNAIQRAILRKLMHANSRLIAVGDPHQAIYGFRGSDSEAIATLMDEFKCKPMPLSITYRCDKAIVDYAKQWVPHLEARPDAGEGVVSTLTAWDAGVFTPDDLVVCRTMKELVQLGFKLIREQVPANIRGKEIGEGLRALLKRMAVNTGPQGQENLDLVSTNLMTWRDREMAKAMRDEDPTASQNIQDKAEAVMSIIDGMPEDKRSLEQIYAVIDYLFNPDKKAVELTTIHRAKGLEADRVFWLNREDCPPKWVKGEWQLEQEDNLMYVAATRAKHELIFISLGGMSAFRRGTASAV